MRISHHAGIARSPTHSANTSPGNPSRLPVESSGTRLTPSNAVGVDAPASSAIVGAMSAAETIARSVR